MCSTKKKRYPLLTQANEAKKTMERELHDLFRTYFCDICKGYHVAHRLPKHMREHLMKKFITREIDI
jgi:hypothetical protein